MPKPSRLRRQLAGSPEASFSARSCLRLPKASASLGQPRPASASLGQPQPISHTCLGSGTGACCTCWLHP
eukprot:scaffold35019_cov52-Phaeocystis_antarctica.AAC.5